MNAIPTPRNESPDVPDEELIDGSAMVRCSARLHLGFFDLNGGLGRWFGSLGLSLDRPVTRLVARRAAATRVRGPEHERVMRYLTLMCERLGLSGHHDVEVRQAMPSHAGLGSGTQLALAVATALRRLHGCPDDPREDAALLGRGARSGIGIGLFDQGGLVIDGGKGRVAGPPPLLVRYAVPEAWRVLLVLDRDREGLSGSSERAAFASLPPMDSAVSGSICRLVLMQALPALAEQDLAGFGAAIAAIQGHVGDYFAPCQGGRFTSPLVGAALGRLAEAGATGIGQSSWGPTGFAFAASDAEARRLADVLAGSDAMRRLDLLVCRVLNHGASVSISPAGSRED
jgi:beta-ribofuranosylaminobenzene 5'-phosphate synthase